MVRVHKTIKPKYLPSLFIIVFLFFFQPSLTAQKKIYIKPWEWYKIHKIWDLKDESPYWVCKPTLVKLKNILETNGYIVTGGPLPSPKNQDILFVFDLDLKTVMSQHYPLHAQRPKKKIALLWESEVVLRRNFNKKLHTYFNTLFTWNDDLVDNKKYFKFYWPQPYLKMIDHRKSFNEKKFCVLIAGCKQFNHPQELYSQRREVIEFFENIPDSGFEFFGGGNNAQWNKDTTFYKNYRGPAPTIYSREDSVPYPITPGHANKLECLKNYKFCICYENSTETGWVTEKIFDCFIAGCVPIYLGAHNITDFIPSECFIDRRMFTSNDELYSFLKNMTQETYEQYITAIQNFLNSNAAQLFSSEFFIHTLLKRIITNYNPSNYFSTKEVEILYNAENTIPTKN